MLHIGCHNRPGVYLDPWMGSGGHWNGLDWIMILVGFATFSFFFFFWSCKKKKLWICTFRSWEVEEWSPRPILSGEFHLNLSCRRIIFIPGSQNVWICISNMPENYLKCVLFKVCCIIDSFTLLLFRLAMPIDAFALRMCSQRHVKNWLEQVQARHTTGDACI